MIAASMLGLAMGADAGHQRTVDLERIIFQPRQLREVGIADAKSSIEIVIPAARSASTRSRVRAKSAMAIVSVISSSSRWGETP
jgi:hypothetical protein